MADGFDLVALQCFVASAEEGSFTAAGARLGVTQQAVSYQVRSLERRVGRPLFERRHSGLVPTTIGVEVLAHARAVVVASDRLVEFVETGLNLIRVAEIRGRRTMRQVWQAHRHAFPEHRISVRDLTGDEQVRALRDGEIDVAMQRITGPIPGLVHEPWLFDPVVVSYPAALDPPRLRSGTLAYAGVPGRFTGWQDFCEQMQEIEGVRLHRIPHDVTMIDAIGRGQIRGDWPPALVLRGIQEYPGTEAFDFHDLVDIQPYFPWSLVWRADETRPDVLALVDTARQVSHDKGWLQPYPSSGTPWFPPNGAVQGFDHVMW